MTGPDTPTARSSGARAGRIAAAVTGLAFLAVFLAWIRTGWGGVYATRSFVDLSTTAIALLASGLAFARAHRMPASSRVIWRAFGYGCLAWGLGNTAWTWYELVAQVSVPFPSLADIGYLLLLPCMAVGLLLAMAGVGVRTSRLRTVLDGLTLGGAVLFVAWPLFLRPIVEYATSSGELLAQAVSLAYPVGDLILIAIGLLAITRTPPIRRRMLLWVVLAITALTVADIGFWYLTSAGTYVTGEVTDAGWATAFVLIGWAAIRRLPTQQDAPEFRPGAFVAALPLAAVGVAAVVALVVEVTQGGLDRFLFTDAFILVGLVSVRQFVMLVENLQLRRSVEEARDRLEERVRERTRELERAKDLAERSSQAKSRFLATMSHELRTPLHGILGLTGTLENEPSSTAATEAATTIRASGEQLLGVLNDILDYSILESAPVVVERTPHDPGTQLAATVELFRPRAAAKGLALEVQVVPPVPTMVLLDAPHIRQVLSKLIDNAIKFTSAGSVRVTFSARKAATAWELRFVVADTGPGIKPEDQGRLFQAFMQADDSSTRTHGGSGLGLAIAKRVVEGMGGTIGVESEVGRFTRFTFTVPAVETAAPAVADPAALGEVGGLRILLVDDNATNQKVAAALLKQVGCAADLAADGVQAVEAARAKAYDVILMDIHMPNLDGIGATVAIRQFPPGPGPRPWIIAMTADTLPEDRRKCLDAGMDDHLPKPVRLPDLRAAFARALQGRAAAVKRAPPAATQTI